MANLKPKIKSIFEIPHFFKDEEGKTSRTALVVREVSPYKDENGFVREGRVIIGISDGKGNFKAFRLSIPEILELIHILEITAKGQLKKLSLLNIERAANLRNRGQEAKFEESN